MWNYSFKRENVSNTINVGPDHNIQVCLFTHPFFITLYVTITSSIADMLCTQNDKAHDAGVWQAGTHLRSPTLCIRFPNLYLCNSVLVGCRIGNLLVPNDNYCKFEDWLMPILDQMLLEQNTEVGLSESLGYCLYEIAVVVSLTSSHKNTFSSKLCSQDGLYNNIGSSTSCDFWPFDLSYIRAPVGLPPKWFIGLARRSIILTLSTTGRTRWVQV